MPFRVFELHFKNNLFETCPSLDICIMVYRRPILQVTFRPPRRPSRSDYEDDDLSAANETESSPRNVDDDIYLGADGRSVIPSVSGRRICVYATRLNVHVGRSVLRRFYVLGFAETGLWGAKTDCRLHTAKTRLLGALNVFRDMAFLFSDIYVDYLP